MDWLELSILVSEPDQARVTEIFESLGALAVTSADAGDVPVLEPAPGETPLWPEMRVTGLFAPDADGDLLKALLAQRLGQSNPISVQRLEDRDWERVWLDDFQPLTFGNRLCICPGHLDPPSSHEVVVRLDPGLAFGTGTHATTAMCLEFLDGCHLKGSTVVDFGCGSGILAVASLKLGATRALCVDNDPQAIDATRDNARRNGVDGGIEIINGPFPTAIADLVIANILAGPLVELAPALSSMTRPGGRLVLSGVLAEQRDLVENAYHDNFSWFDCCQVDGWIRLDAIRE